MKNSQLKKDMWVVCLSGFNNDGAWKNEKSGGAGWQEGKIFKINNFSDSHKGLDKQVAWPTSGNGIFCQALRLATEWEIANLKIEKPYEIY